jgi:hypothetical protein
MGRKQVREKCGRTLITGHLFNFLKLAGKCASLVLEKKS